MRHRPPGYRACPPTAGRPVGFSPVNPGETRGGQPQAGVQAARQATEDVPDPQGRIARQVFEAVRTELVPADLSFGGGTVLAARWRHRVSLDVDLFCRPDTYAGLDAAARQRIEVQLASIPGCASERTWCEPIAIYTEIDGIEATVLPRAGRPSEAGEIHLSGTTLRLQATEEILQGKILNRMYETGEFAVRDVYDLACARRHDPAALDRVLAHIGSDIIGDLKTLLAKLPPGWSERDDKQLVKPRYTWNEDALRQEIQRAIAIPNLQHQTRDLEP